ncbi:hypothetical protein LEMLEM_LOCUS16858 [Lemmus lemmus]
MGNRMDYSALRFPRAGLDADRFGLRENTVNSKRAGVSGISQPSPFPPLLE